MWQVSTSLLSWRGFYVILIISLPLPLPLFPRSFWYGHCGERVGQPRELKRPDAEKKCFLFPNALTSLHLNHVPRKYYCTLVMTWIPCCISYLFSFLLDLFGTGRRAGSRRNSTRKKLNGCGAGAEKGSRGPVARVPGRAEDGTGRDGPGREARQRKEGATIARVVAKSSGVRHRPPPRSLAKTSQTSHLQPPSLRTQGPSAANTREEKRSESAPQETGEASRKWSTTTESGSGKGTKANEGRKGREEWWCGNDGRLWDSRRRDWRT